MRGRCEGKKVGVHGLSMGGMVAAHIGSLGLVDFLFVDRSFSSLTDVPLYSMGRWAQIGMKVFTLWKETNAARDFIHT